MIMGDNLCNAQEEAALSKLTEQYCNIPPAIAKEQHMR